MVVVLWEFSLKNNGVVVRKETANSFTDQSVCTVTFGPTVIKPKINPENRHIFEKKNYTSEFSRNIDPPPKFRAAAGLTKNLCSQSLNSSASMSCTEILRKFINSILSKVEKQLTRTTSEVRYISATWPPNRGPS